MICMFLQQILDCWCEMPTIANRGLGRNCSASGIKLYATGGWEPAGSNL